MKCFYINYNNYNNQLRQLSIKKMFAETSFITNGPDRMHLLKIETIDRLHSVIDDLPKYTTQFKDLIAKFTDEDMLCLINEIHRDNDFKSSIYYKIYDQYFDEIEELIHTFLLL